MPELPEVETIKRGLGQVLPGLTIVDIEVLPDPRFHYKYDIADALDQSIVSIDRMAKVLILHLKNDKSMLFHLKMTGQLIYESEEDRYAGGHPIPPLNSPMPNKTTHVIFSFDNGAKLYFNDLRKFGWIKVIPTAAIQNDNLLKTIGPEPLDPKFTAKELFDRLQRKKKTPIKTALMDQTVVSGIGNIYSDEALWLAKIHPKRLAGALSKKEVDEIYKGIVKSLQVAIEHKGSSSKSYVNHKGEAGTFLEYANAYHHTGLPCKRCGTPIVREKINGRSAHYCPKCQRL